MGEYDDFDLDRTTMRAWSRFQASLAHHVVAMEDDDVLVVDAESCLDDEATGAAPYVQFCAWDEDLVRVEVSSNEYLDDEVALGDAAAAALLDLGWSAPTHGVADEPDAGSANYYLDTPRREGDRLAAMAVAALRDVFGVPHPAFLGWPDVETADAASVPDGDGDGVGSHRPDELLAVMAESAEHLRALVGAALTPDDGPPIEYDEDGDIPLPIGSVLLFVRVPEDAPVVELFSVVVQEVQDVERAAVEVAILNRDTRMVKFVLVGRSVVATLHLPASPFAPRQLRTLVSIMGDVVDRVGDDLVARVGGRRAFEPDQGLDAEVDFDEEGGDDEDSEPEETSLHPALLTLLHLDPEGEGVDAELAASVCEFDRDLVLELLTKASEQEISWRKSGDVALIADDIEEAEACFHEGSAWRVTVATLRTALRVIVERQHAESSEARAGSRDARSRRTGTARRTPGRRAAQQSLIDDAAIRSDNTGEDTLFDPDG